MKKFTLKFIGLFALVSTMSFTVNAQDESCNNYTLNCYDSWGDGWNGGFITINGVDYCGNFNGLSQTETLPCGVICNITMTTASYPEEVSWVLSGGDDAWSGGPYPIQGPGASVSVYNEGTWCEDGDYVCEDDGSCLAVINGCLNELALNYNPDANTDDGSCIIEGCTDVNALNYNEEANSDDGSCIIEGCTDATYLEFNPDANIDDGSCQELIVYGCTDPHAWTYNPDANTHDQSCTYLVGCMDPTALNFDPHAGVHDSDCEYEAEAIDCTDIDVTETTCYNYVWVYDLDFTVEQVILLGHDCSCVEDPIRGCMDPEAFNYNSDANTDDGSCCFGLFYTIILEDSYGDGWNGNTLIIEDYELELEEGSEYTEVLCLEGNETCFNIICDGGDWQYEVSWLIYNEQGDLILSGGAPYTGCFLEGCTDEIACNYNIEATNNDGSCEYPDENGDCDNTSLEEILNTDNSKFSITDILGRRINHIKSKQIYLIRNKDGKTKKSVSFK